MSDLLFWHPADTAPKDGSEFQAWMTYPDFDQAFWEPRAKYDEHGTLLLWGRVDYDHDGWEAYGHLTITHWMPQPTAP